jgi:hypothetical protein
MNFDKDKFQSLTAELQQVLIREDEILAELKALFYAPAGERPAEKKPAPAKPAKAKAKKGALQQLVLQTLGTFDGAQPLPVIAKAVAKQRKGTKVAGVATVLHNLAKHGRIAKPLPNTFYLPRPTEPSQTVTSTAKPVVVRAHVEELLES